MSGKQHMWRSNHQKISGNNYEGFNPNKAQTTS